MAPAAEEAASAIEYVGPVAKGAIPAPVELVSKEEAAPAAEEEEPAPGEAAPAAVGAVYY